MGYYFNIFSKKGSGNPTSEQFVSSAPVIYKYHTVQNSNGVLMVDSWEDFVSKKIVFVYNANSGILNMAADYIHKIVSPSTYNCRLCGLTYDNTGMKNTWKEFIAGLKYHSVFLHRDEFLDTYGEIRDDLPCAYLEIAGKLDLFITADEVNSCSTLEDLMELVSGKVDES